MDKLQWIKELVNSEREMEESGVVDMSPGAESTRLLTDETVEFLSDLKAAFVEAASAFNQLKGSAVGNIKIYGIAKTQADFMLFRNGFKLIFSMVEPGRVQIYVNHLAHRMGAMGGAAEGEFITQDCDSLVAKNGPFGELRWTYDDQPINLDYLVRYYMSRFIKDSAK